jgi:23S rRNA (cytosine1962-C5)-methyltransferase
VLSIEIRGQKSSEMTSRLRLRVTASAETILRSGHPWLFAESIREQTRKGSLGELAVIYDRKNQFLALGFFDPASPIRVRILHTGKPVTLDHAWWNSRLEKPLLLRQHLFDDQTTGYRLIHGESDAWPGLVLDRYDLTLVLKLYTAAWLPRLDSIADLITARLRPDRLVLRLSRNIQDIALDQFRKSDGELIYGDPLTAPVRFLESGLRFEIDVARGQKTGFFLDQRENRRHVAALAHGRKVLNVFSFSGAFSLYAARGGATAVTDLDLSRHALDSATRNFSLNQDACACPHELVQADAFEWLSNNERRKFDMIILDPPALAKRHIERAGALSAYRTLALSAIKHLNPGGILVACSCSAHVTAEEFFQLVRNAADQSRRQSKELLTTYQPPDHPATFKEASYLKAIYLTA